MYGVFTNIYHKNLRNVGRHASPMDPSWAWGVDLELLERL